MQFAVTVPEQESAFWVLAVDAREEKLLIALEDGSMRWYPLAECRFEQALDPIAPVRIIAAQPLPVAPVNREARRQIITPHNGAR